MIRRDRLGMTALVYIFLLHRNTKRGLFPIPLIVFVG